MNKNIFGTIIIILAVFLSATSALAMAGSGVSIFTREATEMAKEFSKTALASVKSTSKENPAEAARAYQDLAYENNEMFMEVTAKPYRGLDAHTAFAAEILEHMFRGGTSITETRKIVKELAPAYGKAIAGIIKGGSVAAVSGEFTAKLKDLIHPHYLAPKEYKLIIARTNAQFGVLAEIEESAHGIEKD